MDNNLTLQKTGGGGAFRINASTLIFDMKYSKINDVRSLTASGGLLNF